MMIELITAVLLMIFVLVVYTTLQKRISTDIRAVNERIDDVLGLISKISTELVRLDDIVENEMNEETETAMRRKIEEMSDKVMNEWTDAIVNYSPWNKGG